MDGSAASDFPAEVASLAADKQRAPLRLWPLAVILGLAATSLAGALGLELASEEVESGIPWVVVYATGALTFLALAAWLLLFSGMRRGPKWIIFGTAIGLVAVCTIVFCLEFKVQYMGGLRPFVTARSWVPLQADARGGVDLTTTSTQDVPEFLGPKRQPVYPNVRLATDWTANPPRELWRRTMGPGFSSFAVVGDFAVTQQQEGASELVVCYEWRTGLPRWRHANEASFTSTLGGDGPRATPTIDEGRVYALGATGVLNCLNGRDGTVIWSIDTLQENRARNLDWGVSCSPLIVGNLVVVSAGLRDPSITDRQHPHYALIAYDKRTGQPAWRGGNDDASFCSPTMMTLRGVPQIVVANAGTVTGHDPSDGRKLWEFSFPREMPTVSQVVALDEKRVFYSKGYGAGCGVRQIDRDESGKWTTQEIWSKSNLMRTKFTNVVIHGEQAYGLDDGFLECIDLADGRMRWTTRRHRKADYQHGQVLLVGEVLLVQSEQGAVALVEPTPAKFQELTRFTPLSGRTWNYPVLVGNYLLLRNDREAACFELPRK